MRETANVCKHFSVKINGGEAVILFGFVKGWPGFSPGLLDRSHGGSRAREEDALELFLRHDRLRFVVRLRPGCAPEAAYREN